MSTYRVIEMKFMMKMMFLFLETIEFRNEKRDEKKSLTCWSSMKCWNLVNNWIMKKLLKVFFWSVSPFNFSYSWVSSFASLADNQQFTQSKLYVTRSKYYFCWMVSMSKGNDQKSSPIICQIIIVGWNSSKSIQSPR